MFPFNHSHTAMAAEKAPERDNGENYEHSDIHNGTIHKSSLLELSPEEVGGPGDDPFLSSPGQRRSADGFPRLSEIDRNCGEGSALASGFWSQGVANWRALNFRSTGDEKISDSVVIIEEPSNSSARKDNPKSTRTQSRGKSARSRFLDSWPFEGASAPSSVEDCRARRTPNAAASALDKLPEYKKPASSSVEDDLVQPTPDTASSLDDTPEHMKPAPSSVEDDLVQPTPDTAASSLDNTPKHKKPALLSTQGNPVTFLAPGMRACDRSSELHIQQSRSITSESVQDCPIKPRSGNQSNSLMDADAVSLHVQRASDKTTSHVETGDEILGVSTTAERQPARSTVASNLENGDCSKGLLATVQSKPGRNTAKPNQEIKDDLLRLPNTTKTRPAMPKGSTPGSGAHSSLGGGSVHQQRQDLYIPREPKAMRKSKESHADRGSFTPFTPTRSAKSRHSKSLSAEASAFQPQQPAHLSATPTRSHSNGHGKSASTGTVRADHTFVSSLPNWQRRLWHYGPNSTGPPLALNESGAFTNTGEAQPSIGFRYPEPHQHTPDGQGQFFGTQGSVTHLMHPQSHGSLDPTLHSLPAPLPVFRNDMIDCNAQIDKQGEQNAEYSQSNHFDSYTAAQAPNAAPNAADLHQNGNLYAQDTNGYGPRYYSNHADPSHQVTSCKHRVSHTILRKLQLNQNLYSPLEPHREPSKPNQRTSKDLFIPEDIRLKLHAKTEATLRVFAGKGPID